MSGRPRTHRAATTANQNINGQISVFIMMKMRANTRPKRAGPASYQIIFCASGTNTGRSPKWLIANGIVVANNCLRSSYSLLMPPSATTSARG